MNREGRGRQHFCGENIDFLSVGALEVKFSI
jgi:hypothetical protein